MARTGIARLRHQRHRAYGRMRKQKVAPRYLGEQSTRLLAVGDGPDLYPVVSVNPATDTIELTGHGLATGDGPYRWQTDDTPPGNIAEGAEYYIQVADANNVRLVTSKRNAVNAVPVDILDAGSGVAVALTRHVTDAEAVLSWHDRRRSERVSTVADADDL